MNTYKLSGPAIFLNELRIKLKMAPKKVMFMKNQPLIIDDAPEPTDIIWDHLGAK